MAYQVHYARDTYKPDDIMVPGNSTASNPVEFDLCPAEGPDLARIKSVLVATSGLVQTENWGPDMQAAVIAAFENGAPAFINTIEQVRGMTIPAAMAKRVGIISEIPTHVKPGTSTTVPNFEAPIPVTTGLHFSRICGFVNMTALTMQVAKEIAVLSNRTEIDPRLFVQPSGFGGTGMPSGLNGTAADVPGQPEGNGTAAGRKGGRRRRPPILVRNRPAGSPGNS